MWHRPTPARMLMTEGGVGTGEADASGIHVEWDPDWTRAAFYREEVWRGSLRHRDDWFLPGARAPEPAWVVEWRSDRPGWHFEQALVELGVGAAGDEERRADLASRARALIEAPLDEPPGPFAIPSTDLDSSQGLRDRIEAISHALQSAEHRLGEAARITEEWGGMSVLVALSETLAWLRVLDEVLQFTWRRVVDPEHREAESRRIDHALRARRKLPDFAGEAAEKRRLNRSPYEEWTLLLIDRGLALSPGDLEGLRWLAGKMLHYGPLPVVELRQRIQGSPPHWTWRPATEIFPPVARERNARRRGLYEAHLAGRTMLSSFKLTFMLIEMEHLFFGLIRRSSQGGARDWTTD
jgi:hypothetical protein